MSAVDDVIAEAERKLGSPYVLGAEGPIKFDCSGLMWWIFSQTGNGSLIGNSRKLAAGYAHYFSNAGHFSRSFSDAQRGDMLVYTHNGTHVSHIALYLGNNMIISALVPPWGISKTHWDGIESTFYGVCMVDYGAGRDGPDTTDAQDDDPEVPVPAITQLAEVQILYQGVDISTDVFFKNARFLTQAGGQQPGQCQIRVRDKGHIYPPGYFHVGGTLELWINGQREWDGWVMGVGREYAFDVDNTEQPQLTPRWWALEGYDRNLLFNKRFHFDKATPENADFGTYPLGAIDQDVIYDVLNNYTTLEDDGLDLVSGITAVGPIDPYQAIRVVTVGMSWNESMSKLSLLNGAIFYIDPDRVVRYVDDSTMTAPFALSDEPLPGQIGYRDMVILESANEMANEAFIWGVGIGNSDPAFAHTIAEDGIAVHGLFQYGEVVQGVYKQASVEHRADTLLNGSPAHQRGHKYPTVRIECAVFQQGLRVGMGVDFHSGAWDLGGALAVGSGDYTPAPGATGDLFDRFLAQIRHIESNSNYDPHHQNTRSGAMGAYQIMPGSWKAWAPLALNLPRSVGVAAKDLDVDFWYPPPTAANQETVARWRLTLLYQHKGDLRRVAASWRSGPSVGNREPSEWSRGTIFYVNHACVPLGFPVTTTETVLVPLTEPDLSRTDYGDPINTDDIYPVRRVEMTFPTPNSVKYALMLSHELDAPWATSDPIPPPPPHPPGSGGPQTEIIYLTGDPGGYTEPQPGGDGSASIGDQFSVNCGGWAARGVYGHNVFVAPNEQWVQDGSRTSSDVIAISDNAPGIHSSVGYPLQNILETVPMNTCADDAWTNWEDCEQWYGPVSAGVAAANKQFPFELTVADSPQLVSGYVPSVQIGVAHHGPEDNMPSGSSSYGTSSHIGECLNLGGQGSISYPSDWRTRYGQPLYEADFSTFIMPKGSVVEGDWITVSPGWQCERLDFPRFFCDTGAEAVWGTDPIADAANNRGPIVSGMGQSGKFSAIGPFQTLDLLVVGGVDGGDTSWETAPDPGHQNNPATYWAGGVYRTLYPYVPGTLELTWQGVKLTRGVDYTEIDPARGIFSIASLGSGEGAITVHYWAPANAVPTDPLPDEPNPPNRVPPGTTGTAAIEAVIAQAYSMLGVPYLLGAESRTQTDCSGLVFRCFTDAGVPGLIGNSRKLAAGYTRYFADQGMFSRNFSSAQRGDLLVYSENGVHVSHIGIYLGSGLIISALINPWGVTKTHWDGITVPFYGVCMVPYDRARTSTDTTDVADSDPESSISPTTDLPPQTVPPTTGHVYRPRGQQQTGWGTPYDGQNSNMACSAMCLDRHTLGVHSALNGSPINTPPTHRQYSGVTTLSRAGTTIADAQTAWSAGWGETLLNPGLVSWEFFKFMVNDGRGAILHGVQMALPDEFRKIDWPDAHALYVNEQLPDGTFWGYDPLYREPVLYPEAVLQTYAQAISGADAITCGFSRQTPRS